ncbi:MAG: formylglycine-generating enzyme family protein [Desulfobacteraceae bacterium]|nr:formylglycine-generating enzyme family protein [Desulfobacteraceae bacterium]
MKKESSSQKPERKKSSLIIYVVISLIAIVIGVAAYWWFIARLEIELIRVPGGEYTMGCISGDTECEDNEKPPHKVSVKSFLLGKYEVTQGQWKSIMGDNPSSAKRGYNYPVENVSWGEIQEFIRKLNEKQEKISSADRSRVGICLPKCRKK